MAQVFFLEKDEIRTLAAVVSFSLCDGAILDDEDITPDKRLAVLRRLVEGYGRPLELGSALELDPPADVDKYVAGLLCGLQDGGKDEAPTDRRE